MIPVVVELDAKDFKPGELVRIILNEKREQKGIWVPTVALVPRAKGLSAVYVVTEKENKMTASLVPVDIVFNDGERTLVKGTLNDDDQIATEVELQADQKIVREGVQRITSGQEVSILKD